VARVAAVASWWPEAPRRQECRTAPQTLSPACDAGSEFDGAPRTVLPVHARAGEEAAATPWLPGSAVSHIVEAEAAVADLLRELGRR
jgi:hypothetical protein